MRNAQPYLENAVLYQINLRAFTPDGTLKAAEKLLPHIRSLGVDIVYLCACFDADPSEEGWSPRQIASATGNPKNPYRIRDYYNVDLEYGTNDDLKEYIAAAHRLGMKVLLDLVYFHCGPSAVFLDEHPDFILRNPDGTPVLGEWLFPELNYSCADLRKYLIENMKMYVRDFGADGFRCDVGDNVPLDFWIEARAEIDAIAPDCMMLNEGWKPAPDYLDAFDLIYGCLPVADVVEGEKPVSAFADTFLAYSKDHLRDTFRAAPYLENHDFANDDYENRIEKRIGTAAMDAGLVVNFTVPGVPFLYNGVEVCDTHRHSIWGNRLHGGNLVIDWQNAFLPEAHSRTELLRALSGLRKSLPALGMNAGIRFVDAADEKILAFLREKDGERIFVAVNLSDTPRQALCDVAARDFSPCLSRGASVSTDADGKLAATLDAYGYAVVALR